MKRSFLFPALMTSCFAMTAIAQTPAAPLVSAPAPTNGTPAGPVGPAKIAVVAFQVAVSQTNEFQRAFIDLQKKWDPKRQQLKTLSDELDRLTKDYQAQGDKLSEAERASRAKTIEDKKKQFDREQGDDQNDFQQEMQDLYAGTASKVYDVLSKYAETDGYTLVLDISAQQTPVLYALQTTDITKPVIEAYNVKSGVPPPPPGSATPTGTAVPGGTTAPKAPAAPRPTAPKTPPSN